MFAGLDLLGFLFLILKTGDSLVEALDVFVKLVVALTRLFCRFFKFLALASVFLEYFNKLLLFLKFDLMLGRVGFTLFLDLNFLLINLRSNLLLNLSSCLFLFNQLSGHLGTFVINFLFEFFVFASKVLVLLCDFINSFLVFLVFFVKLSFDTVEVVVEALLDRFTLVPFLLGDLVMADCELLVLVIVLTSKYFVPLLD